VPLGSRHANIFLMNRSERRATRRLGSGESGRLLAAAIRCHEAGSLIEAERHYRGVLSVDPGHVGALRNLGMLMIQTDRYDMAVDLIGKALARNSRLPDAHYHLALALEALGRLDGAAVHYVEALSLKPDYVEAHMNLGNLLSRRGKTDEALACYERVLSIQPQSPIAHYNVANLFAMRRKPDDAAAHYRKAIAFKPDFAEAHNNLGNALRDREFRDAAEAEYRRALELKPDYAEAHNNLGIVMMARGAVEEAIGRYRRALQARPDFVEAHNNLGLALLNQGETEEAIPHFQRAVALKPDYAEAHNNLGNVMVARGAIEAAIDRYRQALQARPDFVEAHNNLGLALQRKGKAEEAIAQFQQAITLKPDHADSYLNLARQFYMVGDAVQAVAAAKCALALRPTPDTKNLFALYIGALPDGDHAEPYRELIGQALREGWTRLSELERVSTGLVKRGPSVARALMRAAEAATRQDVIGLDGIAAISGDGLLRDLMTSAKVSDCDLERLLTIARRDLLAVAADETIEVTPELLNFSCALAQQCFINEYVFVDTADELQMVRRITDATTERLRSAQEVPLLWPAVIAAYGPLCAMPESDRLLGRIWPAAVVQVLTQQIREPREEQEIRAAVPNLTSIDDGVSRLVQDQYEQNPYPRWVTTAQPLKAYAVDEYFRVKFPRAPMRPVRGASGVDILVAGCGTGASAIETCRNISGARVLAIDLSRTSLAYAIRKTRALGLPIDYAQADILKLGGIGRTFDLIDASGVLHHLADPMRGWRILLSLLKPNGIMSVGLYSRLARVDVNAARAFIAEREYQPTAEDIRRCRKDLLEFPDGAPGANVTRSGDFFSMSDCRDLLFHVQENQHTLPEIAAFIAEENLRFLGFDLDARILKLYGDSHADDPAMIDLALWHQFENKNARIFAHMYQFAVQKA
jgi:tetratricopeptide (TPR) repeat protein/SAM-dependent methyltransferase